MMRKILLIGVSMLLSVGATLGQSACELLVERALQAVDDNCNDLSRNTACYAYNQVQATFLQDVASDFFSTPSDRADLTFLETIQTTPLDEANDLWGIAMMNVQANVPNTLPGQAVIFMLMGDVQVENAVEPDDVVESIEPISVTTLATSSNIRHTPSANGFVLGTAPQGATFETDGISADGEWIRIIFSGQPAWISTSLVDAESSLSELPVLSELTRTPMQAFYFSTGTGASSCNEAPNSLMVQGPNSLEVAINANGVDIAIGSTMVMESDGESNISITAINGFVKVDTITVPGGFTIDAQMDEDGTIMPETLAGLRPMEDDQLERFKVLEQVDGEMMNYQVKVPTRAEINVVQNELEVGQAREALKTRCMENGLTVEQCRDFVGRDTDQNTIVQRCMDAGLSTIQCRKAFGGDDASGDSEIAVIGSEGLSDRCKQAGYGTLEACRDGFSGETDERINICTALGYKSRQQCRDAFPDDSMDRLMYCVSSGFSSKAACDAADVGGSTEVVEDEESSSTTENQCQAQGLTPAQCKKAKAYKKCRDQGFNHNQCVQKVGGGGSGGN